MFAVFSGTPNQDICRVVQVEGARIAHYQLIDIVIYVGYPDRDIVVDGRTWPNNSPPVLSISGFEMRIGLLENPSGFLNEVAFFVDSHTDIYGLKKGHVVLPD